MESKELFLAGEHLIQDLTRYAVADEGKHQQRQLVIEELQEIKRNPYSCLRNLAMGEELQKLQHEINLLPENVKYIVELTGRYHGLKVEHLHSLQQTLRKQVLFGWTPKDNYLLKQADPSLDHLSLIQHDLKYYMKHGESGLIPSFIGELVITDLGDKYQMSLLKACKGFSQAEGCPVYVNVKLEMAMEVAKLFEGSKQLVFVLRADLLFDSDFALLPQVEALLSSTSCLLCLTLYSHFCTQPSHPQKSCSYLLQRSISYFLTHHPSRLLLSTGATFKSHLCLYGGHGYSRLFHFLSSAPSNHLQVLSENPRLLLLSWRKEEEKPQVVVKKWQCSFCKQMLEEGKVQKISKLQFEYCSMKCLSAHRQQGFA